MPHFQFPTNYVYWENLKEHKTLKNEILPIINDLKVKHPSENPFDMCKMTTNYTDYTNSDFLNKKQLKKIVWDPINNMINEIHRENPSGPKIEPKSSFVEGYWYNIYDEGDFQEVHNHLGPAKEIDGITYYPSFSLIYILNDEGPVNKTAFIDFPYGNIPFSRPGTLSYHTGQNKDIKEGSVVIFPPFLNHGVGPVEVSGRITIAFNVYSSFVRY